MRTIYAIVLILLCTKVNAQNKKDTTILINEVVINENRFSTPISKQNRNVYIIDKEMIAKLPGRTLQELLQYANGVDVRQRGPFGTQADISIDGGSFEQTVVLVNGTKIIDTQTAHNMLNLPIPVEAIERIEIIRGPAARIYGINSLTGAINIITKKPEKSGYMVNVNGGSNFEKDTEKTGDVFYARGIQLGTALHKKTHQHSLFGSHDKSNGYRYNTQFENNKLYYQGNYQLNETNEIQTSFGYINNDFGANGFYAAPNDRNATESVQTTIATAQSKHLLSKKWTLLPRLSYRYNYDDYRYLGNLTTGRSRHFTNTLAGEVNATYTMESGELGFGSEIRNEEISSSNIGQHDRRNLGIYGQYRTYLLENLNVNVGTYINYNSDYKWQIYPGMDASYALSNGFKIVGNIGTSQRIPSFTDLYLNQPSNKGNAALEPENAFQAELGFKYAYRNFSFDSYYFYRNISNYIDWIRLNNTTDPYRSNNIGRLVTGGLNIRANYSLLVADQSKLNFNLGYSYLDTEFRDSQPNFQSKYAIASLRHQVTNTVDLKVKQFSVLLATRFNERLLGRSYWVNDFRLSQSIHKVTVYVDAQNIFDATYVESGAIPLPSRWFSLGLKFVNL